MTPERETPASPELAGQGGTTGVDATGESVPGWARRRGKAALVRFQGEYHTPEALAAQIALQASQERVSRGGPKAADAFTREVLTAQLGESRRTPPTPRTPPADRCSLLDGTKAIDTATGEVVPLPCRSLETTQPNVTPAALVGPRKKVALALSWNVASMCKTWGIERVGFLTLTFADHVTDSREAQRRFNSLATHILRKRYPAHIAVMERQASGRIHYHLLVVLAEDIRTGVDFDELARFKELGRKAYRSAPKALAREWAFWRKTSKAYGFGRTELLPIKSDADAMGQYVGKYIAKGQAFRTEDDKGVRLVRYSGGARMATCKFAELGSYPTEWRAKVCTFVRQMAEAYPHRRIRDMDDLAFHFGSRWAFHWRDYILALPPSDLSIPF